MAFGANARWRYSAQRLALNCLFALALFWAAGTANWGRGWLFVGLSAVLEAISLAVLAQWAPEMMAHRGAGHHGVKGFDRFFGAAWLLVALATPAAAGLDRRYGWTVSLGEQSGHPGNITQLSALGMALLVIAYGLGTWAMLVNRHFEQFVRIQDERSHRVVADGPYRLVRHPGYLAAILGTLGTPMLLGSRAVAVGAVAMIALFWWRTSQEDMTLRRELPGYADYVRRARYRLVPGVW